MTLALYLLASAITAVETTSDIRCTRADVVQMRAELRPDITVPGVIGLVRRTCK